MAKNAFIASVPQALFDLRASFDNRQLAKVLHVWQAGSRTEREAKILLRPFRTEWTVVLSDSSGLSRLSAELPLHEVLALIQGPKEHVYANGTAIGGMPAWIWAADNSAMFYPSGIPITDILGMLSAQREAMSSERVKIGIGVHSGAFYRLWDQIYGEEFAFIDEIAENRTAGDEIVVTEPIRSIMGKIPGYEFSERGDIEGAVRAYRMEKAPAVPLAEVPRGKYHFALPFPFRFHQFLKNRAKHRNPEAIWTVMERYTKHRTVVLVDIPKPSSDVAEVSILEGISSDFGLRKTIRSTLRGFDGQEIKTWGGMGILAFADAGKAKGFAKALRENLFARGIVCRIGIDRSDVLLFRLGARGYDIAGTAVNVASKLAQDCGEYGKIYVTDPVGPAADRPDGLPFSFEISRVRIRGTVW